MLKELCVLNISKYKIFSILQQDIIQDILLYIWKKVKTNGKLDIWLNKIIVLLVSFSIKTILSPIIIMDKLFTTLLIKKINYYYNWNRSLIFHLIKLLIHWVVLLFKITFYYS